jgi:hypothetical protein
MTRFWIALIAPVVLTVPIVYAQVPPPRLMLTPQSQLTIAVDGPDLASVQACSYRAYLDGAPLGVIVPAVTCVLGKTPTSFTCTTPTLAVAFPALKAGFHAMAFTHTPPPPNGVESARTTPLPFTYTTAIAITSVGAKD